MIKYICGLLIKQSNCFQLPRPGLIAFAYFNGLTENLAVCYVSIPLTTHLIKKFKCFFIVVFINLQKNMIISSFSNYFY